MAVVRKRKDNVHPLERVLERRIDNHPDRGAVTLQQMRDLFNEQFQGLRGEVAATLAEVREILLTYHNIAKSLTRIESDLREFIDDERDG